MAGTVRIKFISKGFRDILTSNGTFSLVNDTARGMAGRMRCKTKTHVFRGRLDKRPIGAVWTNAKTEEEAYEARKQMRGAL